LKASLGADITIAVEYNYTLEQANGGESKLDENSYITIW
jgi:hypothetical protein